MENNGEKITKPKVFYLCDGEACQKPRGCYKKGGDCRHTSNPEHAINFRRSIPGGHFWECEQGGEHGEQ